VAYVREKKTRVGDKVYGGYYQLVEGYREDGKVKQRLVTYLGKCGSKDEAEHEAEKYYAKQKLGLGEKKLTIPVADKMLNELYKRRGDGEDVTAEVGAIYDSLSTYQRSRFNYHGLINDYTSFHMGLVFGRPSKRLVGPRKSLKELWAEREERLKANGLTRTTE